MPLVTAAVIGLVGGVASAGIGAASASKTRKENSRLSSEAQKDEEDRRRGAAREAQRLIDEYNELRDERPDVSIEAFLRDKVKALNNVKAREAFENSTKKDFENAQLLADEASKGNVRTFDIVLDKISGGAGVEAIKRRNEIAFSTNELDAFNRALQLRSPAIPAGTVRLDNSGRFVEGQRADRQVFQTAFEVGEQQRGLQFDRLNAILGSDRDVALRQQQRALEFLPATSYTSDVSNLALTSKAAQIAYQQADEQFQQSLINGFLNSAFTDQTAKPAFGSTDGADALTAKGLDLAVRSVASLGGNRQESPQAGQLAGAKGSKN